MTINDNYPTTMLITLPIYANATGIHVSPAVSPQHTLLLFLSFFLALSPSVMYCALCNG